MPALSHVLLAFEAVIRIWEEYSAQHPEVDAIIQEGLMKLGSYQNHTNLTPPYCLAMHIYIYIFIL